MNSPKSQRLNLTASERRFVREMELIKRLPLSALIELERFRAPVGI